jgi:hypothetical protein
VRAAAFSEAAAASCKDVSSKGRRQRSTPVSRWLLVYLAKEEPLARDTLVVDAATAAPDAEFSSATSPDCRGLRPEQERNLRTRGRVGCVQRRRRSGSYLSSSIG